MAALGAFREESEERIAHRLEAFSDIVIGFSLAELTLNLNLPSDALTLFTTHWVTLNAFAITFAVVSWMWWSHHRLFTHYFVPTTLNIILNFLSLGGVMFLVYSLQVWLHATQHRNVGFAMYCFSITWITAIVAFLAFRGIALRGHRMQHELAVLGRSHAIRLAFFAAIFALMGVANILLNSPDTLLEVLLAVVAVMMLSRLIERRRTAARPFL
jgi:uncharacterized membrane protein